MVATVMPPSTTHQRYSSANVIAISCDLSPSSATKMTATLNSTAANTHDSLSVWLPSGKPGGDPSRPTPRVGWFTAEGLAHRPLRRPDHRAARGDRGAGALWRTLTWRSVLRCWPCYAYLLLHAQLDTNEIATRTVNLSLQGKNSSVTLIPLRGCRQRRYWATSMTGGPGPFG